MNLNKKLMHFVAVKIYVSTLIIGRTRVRIYISVQLAFVYPELRSLHSFGTDRYIKL